MSRVIWRNAALEENKMRLMDRLDKNGCFCFVHIIKDRQPFIMGQAHHFIRLYVLVLYYNDLFLVQYFEKDCFTHRLVPGYLIS